MKKTGHRLLTVLSASLVASSGIFAQNSSYYLNSSPISGVNNAGFGISALNNSTTGQLNVAFGSFALANNTSGSNNSGIGASSLGLNTTGSRNTGCGLAALARNATANDNCAFGFRAMQLSTTAYGNCAFGSQGLNSMATGAYNSAFGFQALFNNTNGNSNVAVGSYALWAANGSGVNTAIGGNSMLNTTIGVGNTSTGFNTLYSNTTGNSNQAFGGGGGYSNTSGSYNTFIGYNCGFMNTTGSNNTFLGTNSDVNGSNYTNATAIGNGAVAISSDRVRIGNASVLTIEGQVAYSFPSDGRFKTNIRENDVKGLEFIKLLRPVVYNFDTRKFTEFITKDMGDSIRKQYLKDDFTASTAVRQSGFIAQEVEAAAKKADYDFNGVIIPKDEKGHYSVAYSEFVVPLVKAVQEQQAMIEDLKTANALQQQQIEELLNKTTTGIGSVNLGNEGFALSQNVPNPFSNETVIKYTLTAQTKSAALNVYDLSGKQITSFPLNEKGSSSITITSEKLAAGIYIYSIVVDGKIMDSKRMVVAEK